MPPPEWQIENAAWFQVELNAFGQCPSEKGERSLVGLEDIHQADARQTFGGRWIEMRRVLRAKQRDSFSTEDLYEEVVDTVEVERRFAALAAKPQIDFRKLFRPTEKRRPLDVRQQFRKE